MDENERELLSDLRALAEAAPREAPAHIKERLLCEFRKRSARRRRMAWLSGAGIGAIAAAFLLWIFLLQAVRRIPVQIPGASTSAVEPGPTASALADAPDAEFYPLPEAEGLPPVENATVIRVQMPIASLQLMGLDVTDESPAEPVQADILLGQDGLARGVRLVQ